MHPAYSVIFFTTASGAGYGLLIWLCITGLSENIPLESWFVFFGFGFAFGLITLGFFSSFFHLGRPERAWLAFSQWQTSWLSREGLIAMATYIPSGLLAIGWFFLNSQQNIWSVLAVLTILSALVTIYCTGMIYASLRTIRQWNLALVPYMYIILGLATGAILFHLLVTFFSLHGSVSVGLVITSLIAGFIAKNYYWHCIDNLDKKYTSEAATGLGHLGKVRPLDPPHSRPNYVMREMGYKVARKHADKLRQYTLLFLFVIPLLATCFTLIDVYWLNVLLMLTALISMIIGIITERWLFFAEAQHVVTIYYGENAA